MLSERDVYHTYDSYHTYNNGHSTTNQLNNPPLNH